MGPTAPDLLATVLAYDDARGAPLASLPHCGYQRMQAGAQLVIADTGRAPPVAVSQEAHAGFLSFELSSNQHRIVVNCGLPPTSRESWRPVARATAAHSTVTFNDVSSCQFLGPGPLQRFLGAPIIEGPAEVPVSRQDREDAILARASHDGYAARFGVVHQRALRLAADGSRLDGEDRFLPAHGDKLPSGRGDAFAVRFHLHPAVKANRLTDGRGAMLMLPSREVWTFSAYEDSIELEESVYLAGREGPRRTTQLVIYGRARKAPSVRWSFVHADPTAPAARRGAEEQPELGL
jgi:uncharacterized heparinase superfamily protein